MDPDACWDEAVRLATKLELGNYSGETTEQADDGYRLGELVTSLNSWMLNGGFPPRVFERRSSR